jgi:hypothetical protein
MRWAPLASLLAFGVSAPASAASTRLPHDFSAPVFVAAPPGDPRLFVVERRGRIQIFVDGAVLPQPFLDVSDRVDEEGEGGLLGLAFAPDFAASRAFYVYYTEGDPEVDNDLTSRISRFRASVADPNLADPAEKVLLSRNQPFANHNGGTVAFGSDGYLYFGFGDGGLGGDTLEVAQDLSTLLGKMIRIDVSFSSFDDGYGIPPDNPFVGVAGARAEIWALGLRNPFRFSFDRSLGDLYIGDVGQSAREEIDVEPRPDPPASPGGRNYGWDVMEGTTCFESPDPGEPPCNDPSLTLPVHEYLHGGGLCSVTGGVVYRGAVASLRGHYLFADLGCTPSSARIWSLVWDGDDGIVGNVVNRTTELAPDAGAFSDIVAFGEGGAGEVYIVDLDGEVFLIPEPAEPLLLACGAAALLALAPRAQRTQSRGTRKRSVSSASREPGSGR